MSRYISGYGGDLIAAGSGSGYGGGAYLDQKGDKGLVARGLLQVVGQASF